MGEATLRKRAGGFPSFWPGRGIIIAMAYATNWCFQGLHNFVRSAGCRVQHSLKQILALSIAKMLFIYIQALLSFSLRIRVVWVGRGLTDHPLQRSRLEFSKPSLTVACARLSLHIFTGELTQWSSVTEFCFCKYPNFTGILLCMINLAPTGSINN